MYADLRRPRTVSRKMPFAPFNDEHSVQSAAFTVVLNRRLPPKVIEALRSSPGRWRADLPAVSIPQLMEVGAARPIIISGAEFAFKRPDGTDVSKSSFLGNDIQYETTRYTRWQPVWEKVDAYLSDALPRVLESEGDADRSFKVRSVVLQFADVFRAQDDTPDFRQVLADSDEIPRSSFARGELWHSHTGWFVPRPRGRILSRIPT